MSEGNKAEIIPFPTKGTRIPPDYRIEKPDHPSNRRKEQVPQTNNVIPFKRPK